MNRPAIDHRSVALLGLVTIVAYGTWYYSFGVLLDPIREDTGWRESSLTAGFSVGLVAIGFGSMLGGRLLDRVGSRWVFAAAGVFGGSAFLLASAARNVVLFSLSAAAGMALFGALGFYHATMASAVRVNPHAPTRSIAVLTIWGALASAIYLPLTGWLVERVDWRTTVRILAGVGALIFLLAAAFVPVHLEDRTVMRPPMRAILKSTVRDPAARSFTLAIAAAGFAISTLLVYQVPVMTAAGLALGTATAMAGLRGVSQLTGRIPLTPLVARLGTDGTLMLAFAAVAAGGILLLFAATVPAAIAFALVAGFGIGAYSPLQGIKAEELFDRSSLGATMGLYGTVHMLSGALGPAVAGQLADRTGDRRWAAALITAAACVAFGAATRLQRQRRRPAGS